MKNKRVYLIILAVLVVITAVLAVVHVTTRERIPDGAVLIRQKGEERYVTPKAQFQTAVKGTIVNGKGEEKIIDAKGIALKDLAKGEFNRATVIASDEYSAVVNAAEADNAYLILSDDGSVQLVVFGDTNSKRAVRNVAIVSFE